MEWHSPTLGFAETRSKVDSIRQEYIPVGPVGNVGKPKAFPSLCGNPRFAADFHRDGIFHSGHMEGEKYLLQDGLRSTIGIM